ncbi:MAG: ABC transporter ATP-binding protein [Firmicutes bacterium HGW-Firmicutes-16]|nr:MAG: ABC transporter ATP-binding protein [Firmicutes bacterium HGW-Firmicutes-16]
MLEVTNLCKSFESGFWRNKKVNAVDDISFQICEGEIFGLIGGSGCGKTTTSRMIMGFLKPDSGSIRYNGRELSTMKKNEWLKMRRDIQIVFQNPQMTFNPRSTVYNCCAEPIRLFHLAKSREEERSRVYEMLDSVGVSRDQSNKYPHEISGGQAQRLSIVRALSVNPKLLICDEPTSMLDVSVQAQVIALIKEKQMEKGISILYVSHDLDVIKAVCQRVAVMNNGKIVEMGSADEIFNRPKHSYTQQLMSSAI